MTIRVCGINHETAEISIREKAVVNDRQLPEVLTDLLSYDAIEEGIILSTCNRTEIYVVAESTEACKAVLKKHCAMTDEELQRYFYEYTDFEAVTHIMQVACGLNSMVLGEPQILGQMKAAVAVANECQAIGTQFHALFQKVFSIAKDVRTTTEIGVCPISIASIAVKLAKRIFADFGKITVLLIGTGDTMRLVAKYLHQQGVAKMLIASRHPEKAQLIADVCSGEGIRIREIPQYLHQADIVMSATASELPLLGKGAVEDAIKRRKHKPMFMVDMAVPRDIEPQVNELDDVYLHTIDDLKSIAEEHVKGREHAAYQAKQIIQKEAETFIQWYTTLNPATMIRSFREHMLDVQQQELERSYKLLNQGVDPKIVLDRLAYSLTNKILHRPSVQIRQAGLDGRQAFLDMVQELFRLG
jgi:glutamyl-tRNA reductase